MPGGECLLGDPKRQAAPPDQSRIIVRPVRHPVAHLRDLVASAGIGFVGHGSISKRNQSVLQADARAVTRPGHNLRSIRAPTPFHPVPITASSWRVTAAIGTFWCDGDDLLTLAPIRLPIGPPGMA